MGIRGERTPGNLKFHPPNASRWRSGMLRRARLTVEFVVFNGMPEKLPVLADGGKPPPFPIERAKQDHGWAWVAGGLFLLQLGITFFTIYQTEKLQDHGRPSLKPEPEFSFGNLSLMLVFGFFAALPALGGSFIAAHWGQGRLRWTLVALGIGLWCLQSWWPYFR